MYASLETVCAENPETFINVSVSFDGPPEIHDGIRAVVGGHKRSMQAVRRLKALQERFTNLGVGVLLCVTSENQDVLADHMEELCRELRPDQLTVNLARGDALDRGLLTVDLERYREICARKEKLQRDGHLGGFRHPLRKLVAARDRLMYRHIERIAADGKIDADGAYESDPKSHLACTAGLLSAVIFEDGKVRACELLEDELGDLNEVDWDLGRIWKAPKAQALRDKIRETRCRCTWECAQGDNILFHARQWPSLVREGVLG